MNKQLLKTHLPLVEPIPGSPPPANAANQNAGTTYRLSDRMSLPWPQINYLVEAFGICPGAPTMLGGYGFSGKTILAQLLALSVASGCLFLGRYPAKKGRVLHLDYEQGEPQTEIRYKRLAGSLGLTTSDCHDIEVMSMPALKLTQLDAEPTLASMVRGYVLCIIDSFRAAHTLDENDAGCRVLLDMLTRISLPTGCTFLVIHHTGKGERQDARQVLRGSSAIFDACGNVLILEAKDHGKKQLSQTKSRAKQFNDKLDLRFVDGGDTVPETGLSLALGIEIAIPQAQATVDERILSLLQQEGLSQNAIRTALHVRNADCVEALSRLVTEKKIETTKDGRKTIYSLRKPAEGWEDPPQS